MKSLYKQIAAHLGRWTAAVAIVAMAALGAARATWQTGEHVNLHRLVVCEGGAVIVNPPHRFLAPGVKSISWSSNGKYLLLQREVDPELPADVNKRLLLGQPTGVAPMPTYSPQYLSIWNSSTEHATDVWTQKSAGEQIEAAGWLPGSRTMVAAIAGNPTTLGYDAVTVYRVDGAGAGLEPLAQLPAGGFQRLWISPLRAAGLVLAGAFKMTVETDKAGARVVAFRDVRMYVRSVRASGPLGEPVALPPFMFARSIVTDASGDPVVSCLRVDPVTGVRGEPAWLRFDSLSRRFVALAREPVAYKPAATGPDQLRCSISEVRSGMRPHVAALHALWLVGSEPGQFSRTLVAEGARTAALAPNDSSVAWISEDLVGVCSLVHLSKDELASAMVGPLKDGTMSEARQIGIGLSAYREDYDLQMPPAASDQSATAAGPYVKTQSILDGFMYTYGGGLLASGARPAETEIGYVPGLGGSAIVYYDGHVVWKNGPP